MFIVLWTYTKPFPEVEPHLPAHMTFVKAHFANGNFFAPGKKIPRTGSIILSAVASQSELDAILLDIDNGPNAMTDSGNQRLYGHEGIWACQRALRNKGCLAVWSAEPNKAFEQLLMSFNFHVRRFRVPAYKGSKSQSRFVWVASEDKKILPLGGGEPHLPVRH